MNIKINRLYPTYKDFNPDRRQDNQSIENERRSGSDRREKDRFSVGDSVKKDVEFVMRLIPTLRKGLGVNESIHTQNWIYGLGMLYRMINESMEDFADLKEAIKPGKDEFYEYQHPFWATRESLMDKNRLGQWLSKRDYTLYDLDYVKKFLGKVGVTGIEKQGDLIKFNGSWISQVLGRASLRIPIQGIALFGFMESYNVFKAENKPKEILKSIITIISVMGLSAICGSIGKPYGKIVELETMGLGIIAGSKLSGKINKKLES